ncbi:hypothetical protein E2C01_072517 [Portunus trituberculatus]|uniref:Uncharacterized protein n=1 Tax=Portunus trituberculatus TaxID=210409 RepID=A0A5B7I7D1_PORTR|nr:hypothetical protein [Portunus trituberculatus]
MHGHGGGGARGSVGPAGHGEARGAARYRTSGGARRRAAVYEVGGRPAHDTSQPTAATDARAACCHRRVHVQAHAPPRVEDYVHTRAPPRPSASVVTKASCGVQQAAASSTAPLGAYLPAYTPAYTPAHAHAHAHAGMKRTLSESDGDDIYSGDEKE